MRNTIYSFLRARLLLSVALLFAASGVALAQPAGTGVPRNTPSTLVNNVTIMPYVTGSYNVYGGKAFPASAKGIGFGGGLAFDLTDEGHSGLYFDFAFQDMRGFAKLGNCVHPNPDSSNILEPADAEHYWQYVLFEPFYKVQGKNKNGYFLIGASFGYAVQSETVSRGVTTTEYALWEGSPYSNQFRLDLRAGLGVQLAEIHTHKLILEARVGYPLTNVLNNDYSSQCADGDTGGWRILTFQANLGLRL